MKIRAIHDAQGDITACLVVPANAPPAALATAPGEATTEVEAREVQVDPEDAQTYQRLVEVVQNFRVEVKTDSKLVRKRPPKNS